MKNIIVNKLKKKSEEIRRFLIKSVSKTGGHLGANLGTIEFVVAAHEVFKLKNSRDIMIFDTGHQGYVHKILTGRKRKFSSLNKFRGMSRFLTPKESKLDIIEASHAGTALSIANGISQTNYLKNKKQEILVVMGDGALNEGMNFEALNHLRDCKGKIIIIFNDNNYFIDKSIGSIKYMSENFISKNTFKNFFSSLGLDYLLVRDGHDINSLINQFEKAKQNKNHTVVHVKTIKGKGLEIAKKHKYRLHFSEPLNTKTGKTFIKTSVKNNFNFTTAKFIENLMKKDQKIILVTPATPYTNFLQEISEKYKSRIIDVGMAEQHAVGFSIGLSMRGYKPICFFQSTFMQRAFDQFLHDVGYMNSNILFISARSGLSGLDSPTHHGIYDLSYLQSIPNLDISYPACKKSIETEILAYLKKPSGPKILLMPYNEVEDNLKKHKFNKKEKYYWVKTYNSLSKYKKITIFCLINTLDISLMVSKELFKRKINVNLVCIEKIKKIENNLIADFAKKSSIVCTIEENNIINGFGYSINNILNENNLKIYNLKIGFDDCYVESGKREDIIKNSNLNPKKIISKILKKLNV